MAVCAQHRDIIYRQTISVRRKQLQRHIHRLSGRVLHIAVHKYPAGIVRIPARIRVQYNDGMFQNLRNLFQNFFGHNGAFSSRRIVVCDTVLVQYFPKFSSLPENILVFHTDALQHF